MTHDKTPTEKKLRTSKVIEMVPLEGSSRGSGLPVRPAHAREIVVEIEGPQDDHGRQTFFAYWLDDYLPPSGVRGQVFRCVLADWIKRKEAAGLTVRVQGAPAKGGHHGTGNGSDRRRSGDRAV